MMDFMASGLLAEWVHIVVIMFLASTIYAQMLLLRLPPSAECMGQLLRATRFNVSAMLLTATSGFARLYRSPRGMDWYLHSGYFHASLALFAVAALWTLLSMKRVSQWRDTFNAGGLPDAAQWARTGRTANAQPLLLVIIVLLMTLMSHAS